MNNLHHALQPALLDRLQDDEPLRQLEPVNHSFINPEALRKGVVRDLEHLLNTSCILHAGLLQALPELKSSVLAYGMPPLAGKSASMVNVRQFEQQVADLIRRFEPRIDPKTLQVRAENQHGLMHLHNVIGLRIQGMLWAQPAPLELVLRHEVDLETGRVKLVPMPGMLA